MVRKFSLSFHSLISVATCSTPKFEKCLRSPNSLKKTENEMHLVGDDVDLDVHADVDVDVYGRGQLVQ